MKKQITILSVILAIFIGTSCTNWLDIRPESQIVLDDYWQNESHVTQVLASCYRSMTESSVIRRMIVWGEVRSDNVIEGSNTESNIARILDVDINASNSYANWGPMYTVINYCNNFMHFASPVVDKDENFTQAELRSYQSEVRTIRALAYFYLVRAFKEVPLITDPSIDDTQDYHIGKSTERELLDYIIAELDTASHYARDSYEGDFPKSRITETAVHALLADVYMWDQQYKKAIEQCDLVMANSSLSLVDAKDVISDVFYGGQSSESIFELAFDDEEISNWGVRFLYGYYGDASGELSFPVFLAETEGNARLFNVRAGASHESENDMRLKDFLNIASANISGYYYIFKYAGSHRTETMGTNIYHYASFSPNWIVYRLSDIMLLKAEALVELNRNQEDLEEALALVNTTYLRSNPEEAETPLLIDNYSDVTMMQDLVLRERQRELLFEGKRWFDLMRLARRSDDPADLLDYVEKKFTGNSALQYSKMSVMDALYFPIAQSELDADSSLVQNEFYELTGSSTVKN